MYIAVSSTPRACRPFTTSSAPVPTADPTAATEGTPDIRDRIMQLLDGGADSPLHV